jgi:aromatic ring hydroxylase
LGANATSFYFTKTERPSRDGILVPGPDWMTTKYEVVDNMIMYPPTGVDFNDLSISVSFEIKIPGIIRNPFKIKKLQHII